MVFGPPDLPGCYAGSSAAPAMINVVGEITTKIRESWAAQHQLDIGEAARALWPEHVMRLNETLSALGEPTVELHRGTYVVSRPDIDDERENLEAICTTLGQRGEDFEELNLQRNDLLPIIDAARFDRGIYVPNEMFIDARVLLGGLRSCLATMPRVQLIPRTVVHIDPHSMTLVDDAEGRTQVDAVILANSFGFNALAEDLGYADVPHLLPVYGVGMTLPQNGDRRVVVRTPVYGSSCGDYAVHLPGYTYVGASALTHTDRVEITAQLQRALDFFDPKANLNGISLRGGVRAMPQDVYPVIGRLGDGIWAAAGFFKSGVTLAPYVADVLAREILGEAQVHENKFGPYRDIGEAPPPLGALVDTIFQEVAASASSSGSRRSLRRYGWSVKLLLWREVWSTVRRFKPSVYYNSDIVQACILDRSLHKKLNRRSRRQH